MGKLLSLLIPCYNAEPYINELLDCLAPQIKNDIEVLIIDDGSNKPFKTDYEWAKVIRQSNKGVSATRNALMEKSTGEYLAFIDADDLVAKNYVLSITRKIKDEKFDYCYLSWRSVDENLVNVQLKSISDTFPCWNRSIWNRVFKRTFIQGLKFNLNKEMGEDAEFLRNLNEKNGRKSYISDYMYFYRRNVPNSLTAKFQKGRLTTRRVIYYFPHVTSQMTYLINEFKELNKKAEIILMTNANDIPSLSKYALVISPRKMNGTELRGYPTNFFHKIPMPIIADIVIWTEKTYLIGGLETFVYNFCKQMSPRYDIIVLYKKIDPQQQFRLSTMVRTIQIETGIHIECKTLIVNRITDTTPPNIDFKQKVQMVHSCKWASHLTTPKDNDYLVAVSEAVAKSYPDFKEDYKVINNVTAPQKVDKAMIIVSATRTGTNEKGQKRMIALSNLLKKKGIPFIWLCFCDTIIPNAPNITFLKPTLNIAPYIKCADYLAQLSDHEGFCYALVEALELGVPVLATDLAVLPEIGFKEGVNGYKIPWEITDKFEVEKIYKIQLKGKFEYKFDNNSRIKQWKEILGEGHPHRKDKDVETMITLKALISFYDIVDKVNITKGEIFERKSMRAYDLMQKKFAEMVV